MRIALTLMLLLNSTWIVGQDLPQEIKLIDLEGYVPEGYSIVDTATGDLNRDSLEDLIMIFKRINEEETSDVIDNPIKRPLALYIGLGDDIFQLAAQNDKVAYCYDCGGMMGDPYQALVIKNGYFTVEHYGGSGWRWTRYVTFKYSPKDKNWYLHKDGGESFHASEPDSVTTNIRTVSDFGTVAFDQFDVYQEE